MGEALKSTIYATIGGLVVAIFTYFFLSPAHEKPQLLNVTHKSVKITYPDSVVNRLIGGRIDDLINKGSDTKSKKVLEEMYGGFYDRITRINNFENLAFIMIHVYSVKNTTDRTISNISIKSGLEFTSFAVVTGFGDRFDTITANGNAVAISLDPDQELSVVGFSKLITDPQKMVFFANDRKQELRDLDLDLFYIEGNYRWLSSPLLNIFAYMLSALLIIIFILSIFFEYLQRNHPTIAAKYVSKGQYEKMQVVLERYKELHSADLERK